MTTECISKLPSLINGKKLSKQEAINTLALFVMQNIKIFNIRDCDDDLKSEIILRVLDKGISLFDNFSQEYGNFYNYFFSFIKNTEIICRRKLCRLAAEESHGINEKIIEYEEEQELKTVYIEPQPKKEKIPYKQKAVDIQAFQLACKSDKYSITRYLNEAEDAEKIMKRVRNINPIKLRKIFLVIFLKGCYNITDIQIKTVSRICNIKESILLEIIQALKNDLGTKEENNRIIEQRRNKAYYQHKKLLSQIETLKKDTSELNEYKLKEIIKKYQKQTKNWELLNKKLSMGVQSIHPTNKAIARVLGICERQVSYYIKNARELEL